jgi:hypothetical protein
MSELSLAGYRHAIRQTYGCESQLVGRERVDERIEDEPAWNGEVLVFDLLDNPIATRCYAWEVNGRVKTALHAGPIDSAAKAVKASREPGGPR